MYSAGQFGLNWGIWVQLEKIYSAEEDGLSLGNKILVGRYTPLGTKASVWGRYTQVGKMGSVGHKNLGWKIYSTGDENLGWGRWAHLGNLDSTGEYILSWGIRGVLIVVR